MNSLEILIVTMKATDLSILKKMNIQSNAVIANQYDKYDYTEQEYNGYDIKLITTNTCGASINRNIAIVNSTADIVVFADDDQVFVDGYQDIILNEFSKYPYMDVIRFGCHISTEEGRFEVLNNVKRYQKAKLSNCMSGGVHALAVKRSVLIKNDISFPVGMGPGTQYYCGEDSVFLKRLLDSKVNFFISPFVICSLKHENSTWFSGYDERYFKTVGYVYAKIYGRRALLFVLRKAILTKKRGLCKNTITIMLKWMKGGITEYYAK